eukprot:s1012_g5.t1
MAAPPRWCDLVDSSSDDDMPLLRQNSFPFYLFLATFFDGLFRPEISLASMTMLQRRLRADARVYTLPTCLQDLVFHLAFYPRRIRPQVRAFVHAFTYENYGPAVLRRWQAWLQMQCFYDPPVYSRAAFAAIYLIEI